MRPHLPEKQPTSPALWGIVLAAGADKRLAPFIRTLRGDDLPKPFVSFIGRRSMLEHTFARAEKLIPRRRLFVSVDRQQLKHAEVKRQLADRDKETVIVQPEDKGSLPQVLLALLHIYHRDPLATVALLPADHFVLEEDRFVSYLYLACRAVERKPSSLVILGAEPDAPEADYGYILSEEEPQELDGLGTRRVSSLVENPPEIELSKLLQRGALWNTMAVVFKAFTLLDLTARIAPTLHSEFERIGQVIGGKRERQAVAKAYRDIERSNFSTTLLARLPEARPGSLLTLPVEGVLWSDWATPLRVVNVLTKAGYLARANDIPERRLFALWANHQKRKRKPQRENDIMLRIG